MSPGRPSISATIARFALAIVLLTSTWWIACEALRAREPMYLGIFLVAFYTPLTAACMLMIPRPAIAFGLLALTLAGIDVGLDLWIPYEPKLLFPGWQALRFAAVFMAAAAVMNVERPTPRMRQVLATCLVLAWLLVAAVGACVGQIVLDGTRDETHRADGALVLGFALDERGQAQPSMIARVDHAVSLYRRGLVPWLVMAGGSQHGDATEASVMRALAEARGVPGRAIYMEDHSRSTVENFEFSAALLDSLGGRDVLLVTEPFHMPRSLFVARRFALDLHPSPASQSIVWTSPRTAVYWTFRDALLFLAEYARGPLIAAHRRLLQ